MLPFSLELQITVLFPQNIEDKLGFTPLRKRLDTLTLSRMGQEAVADLKPSAELLYLQEQLAQVGALQQILRFDDALPFAGDVPDIGMPIRRVQPEGTSLPIEDFHALRKFQEIVRLTHSYLQNRAEKYPPLTPFCAAWTPLPQIEKAVAQILDERGEMREDASPALKQLKRDLLKAQDRLRRAIFQEWHRAAASGYATDDQPALRNGRMVLPIKAEAKRKVEGWLHDISATGQTVYIEPAAVLNLNNEIRDLEIQVENEIRQILIQLASEIRPSISIVLENRRIAGKFDLLLAKAKLGNQLHAHVPKLNEEGRFSLKNARNASLALYFEGTGRTVVPSSLQLDAQNRTLVLTGPNAGGKSVLLKTIGLCALMLNYGLPICADELSDCCVFEHIFADIGDEQSIENDLSTFSSHLQNVGFMLKNTHAQSLILMDEAGTGTDPAEGGALAQAVIEALHQKGAMGVITTHLGALKVFAHETSGISNGSMRFNREALLPTYAFQPEVPGSSYAFEIAERMQIPVEIRNRAKELIGHQAQKLEDLIADLDQTRIEAEQLRLQAETEKIRFDRAKKHYEEQLRLFKASQSGLKEKATAEAEALIQQANKEIERTIREIKEAAAAKEQTKIARERLEKFKTQLNESRPQSNKASAVRSKVEKQFKVKTDKRSSTKNIDSANLPLQIGDQVVLKGSTIVSELVEIDKKFAVIAQDSIRMRVKLEQLSKVGGKKAQKVIVRHQIAAPNKGLGVNSMSAVLDLRGFRVADAMEAVMKYLDEAVVNSMQRVEVLHGTGTGALRLSLKDFLKNHPDVATFEEAPWEEGGAGVTRIELL